MERLNSLRFGTRFLLIVMVLIHIIRFLFIDRYATRYFVLIPALVCKGEIYRLFTSMFLHGGILHLAMNMLSFTQLGASLENRIGTLSFLYHIMIFGFLSSLLHVIIAYIMMLGGDSSYFYTGSLGFSGVLFTLIVIDNSIEGASPTRSLFGLILVPSSIYPWLLLLLMQVILRNVSFLGHLSGLLVGYLYKFNVLDFLTPPSSFFASFERSFCRCCTTQIGYLPAETAHTSGTEYRPFSLFNWFPFRNNNDQNLDNDQNVNHNSNRNSSSAFVGQGRRVGGPLPQASSSISNLNEEEAFEVQQEEWTNNP